MMGSLLPGLGASLSFGLLGTGYASPGRVCHYVAVLIYKRSKIPTTTYVVKRV